LRDMSVFGGYECVGGCERVEGYEHVGGCEHVEGYERVKRVEDRDYHGCRSSG
jgi:hypothetical protein